MSWLRWYQRFGLQLGGSEQTGSILPLLCRESAASHECLQSNRDSGSAPMAEERVVAFAACAQWCCMGPVCHWCAVSEHKQAGCCLLARSWISQHSRSRSAKVGSVCLALPRFLCSRSVRYVCWKHKDIEPAALCCLTAGCAMSERHSQGFQLNPRSA